MKKLIKNRSIKKIRWKLSRETSTNDLENNWNVKKEEKQKVQNKKYNKPVKNIVNNNKFS